MNDNETRLWLMLIGCAALIALGVCGCQVFQINRFVVGGYCGNPGGGVNWVKCR